MPNEPPASDSPESATVQASIDLRLGSKPFHAEVSVPAGPADPAALLPFARQLTDAVVAARVDETHAAGARISCRARCGACCRQVVPLTATEARTIPAVIDAIPEPRRTAVRERFVAARRRLDEGGLLDEVLALADEPRADRIRFALAYFALGIPCPFLEDESCSIYADRPFACREFLVTSPAQECERPGEERVEIVTMPIKLSLAFSRLEKATSCGVAGWIPLAIAPEWAAATPAPSPQRTGKELLGDLLGIVSGRAPREDRAR